MDAIVYLKKEHSKFRNAFRIINNTSNEKSKLNKFNALCKDLVKHETMEENAWYPVLRKYKELDEIIKHLISEEKSAAKNIKKFSKMNMGIIWKLKFIKFRHDIEHHANEEERELFTKVRMLLSKAELNELGTKMKKFKAQLE